MRITEQSSHSSPTDEEDTSDGLTAVETPDCSVVRKRGQYRSREERGWDTPTYDEIAAELGVTRQRVIQIEREALRKLRLAYENLMRVKQVRYDWKPGSEDE
jgi:RNA polymerase nonessential primary-like sigma factor